MRNVEYRQEQQARHSSTLSAGLGSGLTSIGFARLARALVDVSGAAGLKPVTFRSPGRVGVGRAIRRNADGSATVAVRYRGRPALSVAADMIEGVVQAGGKAAVNSETRDTLWAAAGAVISSEVADISESHHADSPPGSIAGRGQSSAARRATAESGSGPSEQADRRAA